MGSISGTVDSFQSGWILPARSSQSNPQQNCVLRVWSQNPYLVGIVRVVWYRIAGNFRGRKLLWIGKKYEFHGKNFHRLLAFAVPKDTSPPNFTEKTFTNSHKTAKLAKVFSLKTFLLLFVHRSTDCRPGCHLVCEVSKHWRVKCCCSGLCSRLSSSEVHLSSWKSCK